VINLAFALLLSQLQWTPTTAPSQASLRGIHAVSDSIVWASGANSTVLRTLDAGTSWQTFAVPGAEGLDFRDIHAWDAQTAIVMSAGPGTKSRLYRTTDGGATWTLSHENKQEKGFFDSIAFWDRKRGILVGDPVDGRFTILITVDGGVSWKPAASQSMPPAAEGEGAFAASGTAIAVSRNGRAWFGTGGEKGGRVFSSTDWGRSWNVFQTPIRHDTASAGVFSLALRTQRPPRFCRRRRLSQRRLCRRRFRDHGRRRPDMDQSHGPHGLPLRHRSRRTHHHRHGAQGL
jgi:photosystem II stability/assembly factor-like uncharacterized protein